MNKLASIVFFIASFVAAVTPTAGLYSLFA